MMELGIICRRWIFLSFLVFSKIVWELCSRLANIWCRLWIKRLIKV